MKEYDFSNGARGKFYNAKTEFNFPIFRLLEKNDMEIKEFEIIPFNGKSQTIKSDDGQRPLISEYDDKRIGSTDRQENFYQNLLRMYLITRSKTLPVYFSDKAGSKLRLDRGCVKMAANDGLIELMGNPDQILTEIKLIW